MCVSSESPIGMSVTDYRRCLICGFACSTGKGGRCIAMRGCTYEVACAGIRNSYVEVEIQQRLVNAEQVRVNDVGDSTMWEHVPRATNIQQ